MKNIYRAIALLLVILTLLGALVSCKKDEETSDDSETTVSTEEESKKSALEQSGLEIRDMGGAPMNIWYSTKSVWSPYPMDVTAEESVGDVINEAGYQRNEKLVKDLNIELKYTQSSTDPNGSGDLNDGTVLRNLWMSGDTNAYDMIFTGAYVCSTLAIEGFFFDLAESEYIHPDADYYESQVNEQARFMGHQFFAMGYYSVMNTAALEVTFVNATIVEDITNGEVTMDALYDKALKNEWTMSEMLAIGDLYATGDTNTGDYNFDQYSAIVSNNGAHSIYHWLGGTTVEWNDASERYNCTLSSKKNVDLLTWIQDNITDNPNFGLVKNDNHDEAFLGKASPFLVTPMDVVWDIMDSGINWGLLPPPCYNVGDEYRSFSTGWNVNFAGIVSSCTDIDKATYLYEMYMCYSYDYIYPAYYEKCFKLQYQPSVKSAQVFDVIAHSRFVDLSNLYSLNKSISIKSIVQDSSKEVGSSVKSASDSITTNLKGLIDNFNNRSAQ